MPSLTEVVYFNLNENFLFHLDSVNSREVKSNFISKLWTHVSNFSKYLTPFGGLLATSNPHVHGPEGDGGPWLTKLTFFVFIFFKYSWVLFVCLFVLILINLFIGCVGSSFLCEGFL